MPLPTSQRIIHELALLPHPEGGYYREDFRSTRRVLSSALGSERSAYTLIYYLLEAHDLSALHRVSSDETWHHYLGDPLELHTLNSAGAELVVLGPRIEEGQRPHQVVPAGCFQAARVQPGEYGFALCGCGVAPGFEFSDFEMPTRGALLARFPDHGELVRRLTRPDSEAAATEPRASGGAS